MKAKINEWETQRQRERGRKGGRMKKKHGALLRLLRVHVSVYRLSQKRSQTIGGLKSGMLHVQL